MSKRYVRPRGSSTRLESLEQRKLLSGNLVADAGGIYPTDSVMLNGESFFTADDGVHGRELWVSDGTIDGTRMLKDITPGAQGSEITNLSLVGNKVVFIRREDDIAFVWRSDGTTSGTVAAKQIGLPGHDTPYTSAVANGRLIFVVDRHNGPITGDELWDWQLWSSDGTTNGTGAIQSIQDISGGDFNDVETMYSLGQHVVYTGVDGKTWSSDGTAGGTFVIRSHYIVSNAFYHFDDKLIFSDNGLWTTDGTVAGTVKFSDMSGGGFTQFGDKLLFEHIENNDPQTEGRWLAVTDGTAQGTRLLARSAGGPWYTTFGATLGDEFIVPVPLSSPGGGEPLTNVNELWKTDGTPEGTARFVELPNDPVTWYNSPLVNAGGQLFFLTGNVDDQPYLWRTDGTAAGTEIVQAISRDAGNPQVIDGKLVLVDGQTPPQVLAVFDPSTMAVPVGPSNGSVRLEDGVLRVRGTQNDDTIRIYHHTSAANRLVVSLNGVKRSFALSTVDRIKIYGYSGNDRITITDAYGNIWERAAIWGGAGNDTVTASLGRDSLYGEAGDDNLKGGSNNDLVRGGDGDDVLSGGNGADIVSGEDGSDHVSGNSGTDIVSGGNDGNQDWIDGGAGEDVLFGQAVFDTFFPSTNTGDTVLDDVLA